jgi:hypothetical protein
MTSSDIIAIIAIIVSAIVSITSVIISYKNNLLAIEARRSELAFEKRLSAFTKITEQIAKMEDVLEKRLAQENPTKDESASFSIEMSDAIEEYCSTHDKLIIFFPKSIMEANSDFSLIVAEVARVVNEGNLSQETIRELLSKILNAKIKLIRKMQSFIGYK